MIDKERLISEVTDMDKDKLGISIQDEKKAAIKRILAHAMKSGVSIERLEEMKKLMVTSPIMPKEKNEKDDGKTTSAYCQGGKIYLLYDNDYNIDVNNNVEHELRHMVIPGDGALQEGIISKYSGDVNSAYGTQIDIAKKLETIVGEDFLAKEAYENEFKGLEEKMNHLGGYNAYEQFINLNDNILKTERAFRNADDKSADNNLNNEVFLIQNNILIKNVLENVTNGKLFEENSIYFFNYLNSVSIANLLNFRYQFLQQLSTTRDNEFHFKNFDIMSLVGTAIDSAEQKRCRDNEKYFEGTSESEKQIYLPMVDALQDQLIGSKTDFNLDAIKRFSIHEVLMEETVSDEARTFLIMDNSSNNLRIFSTQKPAENTRYAFKSYSEFNK
jgi:hypothetical protein